MLVLAMAFKLLYSETFLQSRPPRSPKVYPSAHSRAASVVRFLPAQLVEDRREVILNIPPRSSAIRKTVGCVLVRFVYLNT